MFRLLTRRLLPLSTLSLFLASCGGDSAGPAGAPGEGGMLRGEFGPDAASFEIRTELAPDGGGAFVLHGTDVRWSDEDQALLVDFTVRNDTQTTYPEPVVLTFVQISPPGATLTNSDNDLSGAGAQLVFAFENDDALWSPGEESFVRTAMFDVDAGQGVGFVARIDAGLEPGSGTIGGFVWHDLNANGEIDDDEPGLGGAAVVLSQDGETLHDATTNEDGSYRFDALPAGVYDVSAVVTDGWQPTTASSMTVVLPEGGNFLAASFGCRRVGDDTPIRVGDRVHAKGEYAGEPDRLVAELIEVGRCDDDDDDDLRSAPLGSLRGPATDKDLERGLLYVMGTPVAVAPEDGGGGDERIDGDGGCPLLSLDEVELGTRVRVDPTDRVVRGDDEVLAARRIHCWRGARDRVKGTVQEVEENEDGSLAAIRVLDTWIEIGGDTRIGGCGCDGGDDGDHGDES
ncbi:MAG: SdrD B-like domain-containing protein [bacterium]